MIMNLLKWISDKFTHTNNRLIHTEYELMGAKDKISQIVEDYIEAKDTDYAIMLSGQWGSGKTYYVHNNLSHIIESIQYEDDDNTEENEVKHFKPVYVSLYGVSSADDFYSRVFSAINSWTNNKVVSLIGWGLRHATEYFGITADKKDLKIITNVSQKDVLIFDDFERISSNSILFKEVLGLINTYSENNNLKVIVVCNEDEIPESDYKKYKEKSVRFTYHFEAEVKKVYDVLANNQDKEITTYLKTFKPLIISLFNIGGKKNLRTLKFFIDSMSKIYSLIPTDLKYHDWVVRRLTIALLIYSMEYKRGDNQLEDIKQLKSQYEIDFCFWDNQGVNDKHKDQSYAEKVKERYGSVFIKEMGHYPYLVDYITNGYLDADKLKSTINELENLFEQNEDTPQGKAYQRLLKMTSLEDQEVLSIIKEVLGYVSSNSYNLYQLLNVYSVLLKYDHYHINNFTISEDINDLFIKSMDCVGKDHKYDVRFVYDTPIWDSSNPQSKAYLSYKKLKDYAIAINKSKGEQEHAEVLKQFLSVIESGNIEDLRKYRETPDKIISISDIDWHKIVDVLINGSNQVACELSQCMIFLLPSYSKIRQEDRKVFKDVFVHSLDEYVKYKDFRIRNMYIIELWKHVNRIIKEVQSY